MEKLNKTLVSIILLAALFVGFFIYHTVSMKNLKNEILTEQEQKETLEKRVTEITSKLTTSEEEKESLIQQIDEMIATEEVYFDSAVVMEEIKDIGELATIEYRYTNVGTIDSSKKLFGSDVDIPLTKKSAIITMDGVIKVGVDVDKIHIETNNTLKTITVLLPKAKILSNELDENSMTTYDETNGVFNNITLEDSSSIREAIKKKSVENAEKNGIYDQAKTNAENIVRCIIESVPGVKDNYKILFK